MTTPTFYRYPQDEALQLLPPLLYKHLPLSNSIYNRLQAPHNLPSRHCLFAASLAPNSPEFALAEQWTIIFADRSRRKETQIWIFNSLINSPTPLSTQETTTLKLHIKAAVHFLKNTEIPEAPGWPFDPLLRFGGVHSLITECLVTEFPDAIPYITRWNLYTISTSSEPNRSVSSEAKERILPPRFTLTRVPESQLDIVISTSSIPRQADTLKQQANVGILNLDGGLVAWVYLGIDGSIATLYVLPEYRGKGFSIIVVKELLMRLGEGGFEDLGIRGGSGWVHSEAKAGNVESDAVMRSLGGVIGGETAYLSLDSEKI